MRILVADVGASITFTIVSMLDISYLRKKREVLEDALRKRGYSLSILDELTEIDAKRREIITKANELRAKKNEISKRIGELRRRGEDASHLMEEAKRYDELLRELKDKEKEYDRKFWELWAHVPNIPHESVPVGPDESANVVVREWGERREFPFTPKPHWDIAEVLGILDWKSASEMSGSRFVTYRGLGARLERALINYFLDTHTKNGYTEVFPPILVKPDALYASGHLPKFHEEMYYVSEDDLYLIPTAEASLANLHRGQVIPEDRLPLYYVAYTPCFRREAGSHGRDVRGIIRMHQFNKVELFKYTKPEESYEEHEKMVQDAERILQALGIPYRVVLLSTGDMGFAAAKTYDIEVWAPGLQRWLEASSVSNVEDFQARRANVKLRRKNGKTEYVHMLNGSGLATPRVFIAILENFQQEDGSVVVPEALRPYMGVEVIRRED